MTQFRTTLIIPNLRSRPCITMWLTFHDGTVWETKEKSSKAVP